MKVKLISPFPLESLETAYNWHSSSLALLNQHTTSKEDFVRHMSQIIPQSVSWGICVDDEVIGMILFEPSYLPGVSQVRDGFIHVALARKAWGKGLIDSLAKELIPEVFDQLPSLLRLTAWTLESNWPARRLAERLGFDQEGIMQHAVEWGGRVHNIVLFGLTRGDYTNGWRT